MAASVARNGLKALCGVVIVAALAMTTTAKAGLIGTGSASYCDPTAAQVFAPWDDSSSYASLFNGGFEGGSTGWYLSGGARVVSGNEPFFVETLARQPLPAPARGQLGDERHGLLRRRRLAPAPLRQEHRFADGVLHVQVVVPSLLGGLLTVLDGGTISGDGVWAPSPRLELAALQRHGLLGTRAVAFRFTPVGPGAAFQIDDVYLDPWKDR